MLFLPVHAKLALLLQLLVFDIIATNAELLQQTVAAAVTGLVEQNGWREIG